MRYTYPVLVIEDELGGYCTYLNDFDQVTEGEDIAEAIEMGAEIQTAAKFFPTYWYTQAVTESAHLAEVTWESAAPILGNLGIIVLFAAAVFAVALAAGRVRMRSAEAGGNAAASLTGA